MRSIYVLLIVASLSGMALSQTAPASAAAPVATPAPLAGSLDRLQAAASQTNLDIGHMRIEKWKADPASKQQAQGNADSLQRNLTGALPGLVNNFRAAPQDLNAGFKLYRNLNALYDVLASFAEAAGAFGPKNEYEALGQQVNVIDSVRRELADYLEGLTASNEAELNQLRTQLRNLQQAQAPAAPPKKVVVDDTMPAKKTTHKKKAATASGTSGSSGTTPAAPKPQ